MRTAIYARISRDRAGEALGVARQEEECRALCAARGWEVVEVLVDNDLSAYSGKARPAYARLLDAIRSGDIDALVAWHPDRLHRSPRELETFIDAVETHAVAIATVRSGDLDLATASGRMTARIVGSVARHESEHRSERLVSALAQNAKDGKRHGGPRPFGFEADGVTIREHEARMVRDAATRVLAGESVTEIAREWNAAGVRTAQRGVEWSAGPVRAVLVAPRVAGLRASNGEVMGEAVWDPILPREEWERLTSVLARTAKRGRPATHLLSGFARCGAVGEDGQVCGGPLWGSMVGGKVRYVCSSGPGRPGCGRISIAGTLDAYVRDSVIAALTDDDGAGLAAARQRHAGEDERLAAAHAEVAAAKDEEEEIAADKAAGRLSRRAWLAQLAVVEERIAAAQRVLDRGEGGRALKGLPGDRDALEAKWNAAETSVEWRRSTIRLVVERLVVLPATIRGPKFDEDRVAITWRS